MVRRVVLMGALSLLPGVAAAQQPCTTDARRVVAEVYQRVLERQIDASAENLVAQLNNRQVTVRQIVSAVARLPEHNQRFLSGDRRSAITYLYRHVLGREADPQGLQDYVNSNSRYGDILVAMAASGEYAANFGDYGVPGSSVRFCAPGEQPTTVSGGNNNNNNRRMRFAGMDTNNNGQIERSEWNGTRESFIVQDWNGDNVLSGEEVTPGGRGNRQGNRQPAAFTAWNAETFTTLDRNRDGRVAAAEWRYDTASFVSADRNGDGTLTRAEFLNQGSAPATSSATSAVDTTNEFTALDTNRNGRIERNEWRDSADAFNWLDRNRDNILSRVEVLGNEASRSRFDELDADGNNRLTLSEWEGTRRAFNTNDANGDGVLSRQEFNRSGAVGTTGQ